jgi:hypothetical protein
MLPIPTDTETKQPAQPAGEGSPEDPPAPEEPLPEEPEPGDVPAEEDPSVVPDVVDPTVVPDPAPGPESRHLPASHSGKGTPAQGRETRPLAAYCGRFTHGGHGYLARTHQSHALDFTMKHGKPRR